MGYRAEKLKRRLARRELKDMLAIGVPAFLLLLAGFWAAYKLMKPAPPDKLTIVTGAADGAYQIYATRYKDTFTANRIELEIKASAGALENLERLLDPKERIDVGLVQSGVIRGRDTDGLHALGVLYPEPLWLFHRRGENLQSLDQLKGKRVAVGPEGSGTRVLALELLKAHGVASEPTKLVPVTGLAGAQALAAGEVDAAFIVGAAQSGAVWTMLYSQDVEPFSFSQAEAYVRRFPYLTALTLPRGTIDFERKIPQQDVTLVAPMANLVAREDVHPALVYLLLQAASDVHGEAGLFQRAGQYPTPQGVELPLSKEAQRYYRSGKPFLQRYLPFWAATLIDRLIIMLVPVVALLLPLLRFGPMFYAWRMRSRVFRYYGQLKLLEWDAQHALESKSREQWLAELDRIEQAANRIHTPNAFADNVYTLKAHVHMVRKALLHRYAQQEKSSG